MVTGTWRSPKAVTVSAVAVRVPVPVVSDVMATWQVPVASSVQVPVSVPSGPSNDQSTVPALGAANGTGPEPESAVTVIVKVCSSPTRLTADPGVMSTSKPTQVLVDDSVPPAATAGSASANSFPFAV